MLRNSPKRWTLFCLVCWGTLGCTGTLDQVTDTVQTRESGTEETPGSDAIPVIDETPVIDEIPDGGALPEPDGGTPETPDVGFPGGPCVKPTAANTGVPPGTMLTLKNGDLTIREDGATVTGMEVKGSVTIAANNVTLRNSRVHGNIVVANGRKNAVIDHCDIGPDTGTFSGAIPELVQNQNFTLLYSNLHNFMSGVRVDSNAYVYGNYLHHYYVGRQNITGIAGYATFGPGDIRVECNNVDLTTPAPGSTREVNAAFEVICVDRSKPLQGLVLEHNWFSGGGVGVYAWGFWTSLQITNNTWDGTDTYGPISYNGETPLIWSGNAYEDGSVLRPPGDNSPGTNCHD